MIRVNLLRFTPYLLSDIDDLLLCEFPRSETVTTTPNLLALNGFVVSRTAIVPKNPLRVIVARTPIIQDLYCDEHFTIGWFIDTLECGHQVWKYPLDPTGQKRHRCAECAALSQKKPVSSVGAQPKRKSA